MEAELLTSVTARLRAGEPQARDTMLASVAVILEKPESPKILLIKRAEISGDPWSGQVAFPGGKSQYGDQAARDTAIREAREEVGIDLHVDGEFLGYFESFRTHTGTMEVIPSVFLLKNPVALEANAEVSSYRWVELLSLLSPESKSVHELRFSGKTLSMPAYRVGDYVVWGLTHRILSSLLGDTPPSA